MTRPVLGTAGIDSRPWHQLIQTTVAVCSARCDREVVILVPIAEEARGQLEDDRDNGPPEAAAAKEDCLMGTTQLDGICLHRPPPPDIQ
jgi:hypothetical protein